MVTKSVEEDRRSLNALKSEASAGKDGNAMLNVGYSLVLAGDSAEGIRLMEKGISIKGIKRPEDAKLLYGTALIMAGQREKARSVFASVQGDGTSELAKLWAVYASTGR
jgi:Flp pilus assembly protein TadD